MYINIFIIYLIFFYTQTHSLFFWPFLLGAGVQHAGLSRVLVPIHLFTPMTCKYPPSIKM